MTNVLFVNRIIKTLKDVRSSKMVKKNYPSSYNEPIDKLINHYDFILDTLRKKYFKEVGFSYDVFHCPTCLKMLEDKEKKFNYCPYCGQHIYYR